MQQLELGRLTCQVLGADVSAPAMAVVLCHGFGAPGDDLVGLEGYLTGGLSEAIRTRILWIYPQGPIDLTREGIPGGRAWWPLNMAKLQQMVLAGQFGDLQRDTPPGLVHARGMLSDCLDAVAARWELPASRMVLGGFSQGAMISVDVALHWPRAGVTASDAAPTTGERVAGLVLFSGNLINQSEWEPRVPRLAGVPVAQSHGRQDYVLPLVGAMSLAELLKNGGAALDFVPFDGGHTITAAALQAAARVVQATAAVSVKNQ